MSGWEWAPPIINVVMCAGAVYFALLTRRYRVRAEAERRRADAALAEAGAILAAAQQLRSQR